ncbi:helix-turn-helix transcriptional regulator [Conexibacter sp. W3-3-2]|uniref:ArsR/SmtB family transcription factor n=1 Tax=Conexibacter sp. W3-3-2 TaxID=2675227 RepID=UPI0018A9C430|nr:metalloregulator ArsR/SmtB family transcription factor [Conexibacter sp. W3-3-2]
MRPRVTADGSPGQEQVSAVFAALADPTRRRVVETLLRDGTTSVPALTEALPITRQAVAKHVAILDDAGLVERAPGGVGREVRYRLREEALVPAATWMAQADRAWAGRLARLKDVVEGRAGG